MDKESAILGLIASAAIGFAVYGIVHELQPVFVQAVTLTGIALIIIVCALSLAGLLIIIFLFIGTNNSPGAMIAHELIEQRRINKINALILKEQLAAKRTELRNLEITQTPDYVPDLDGRFFYYE